MKKEIKFGAVIGYINLVVNVLITLLYTPLMLKLMGQSEYGLYSLVTSIIAYFSVLDMGFGNAMIRFVSKSKAKKEREKEAKINGMFLFLYLIMGLISLILGIVVFNNSSTIFSASLSKTELEKAKILLIILLANVTLSFPLSVFDSYVVANEKFVFAKVLSLLKTTLKPLLMIPLLLFGYKSIAMALVVTGLNIACHIITLVFCFSKLKMKITFKTREFDKGLLKEISTYSFFIFLNIIVDNVFNNTDQIILGITSGTIAVSIYAVASQITQMNTQCSTIISGLFLPRITKLLEEKDADKKISDIFIKVSRIQLYIMSLILSGFIVFGKIFIKFWAGEKYMDAYYIVLLIIGPGLIPLTQNIGISVIQAKNIHQFRSIIYIFIAIINVVISIPLAKMYQGIGAAIGTAFANLCGQIVAMNIYYYKKAKLDIPTYWKNFINLIIKVAVLTLFFVLIINKLNITILTFLLLGFIFILSYMVLVYINMNDEEKQSITIFFKRIRNKIRKYY